MVEIKNEMQLGQKVYDESKIIAEKFVDVSEGMHKAAINLACIHVIKNLFDNHVEKEDKEEFVKITLNAIKEMLVVD